MLRFDRHAWSVLPALALTAVLAAAPASALDAWHVLEPPTDEDLNKVDFIDDVRGWVVGTDGTILATNDGGATWISQYSPTDDDLVDIQMLENGTGWALAHYIGGFPHQNRSAIIKTVDGGENWVLQAEFNYLYFALDFANTVRGVLVGDKGEILITADGGDTWNPAVIELKENAPFWIREVKYHSPRTVLAMGGQYDVTGVVWSSEDGGQTWTHRRVAPEPMFGSFIAADGSIVMVGGDLDYGARTVYADGTGADAQWSDTDLKIWGQADALGFRNDVEAWAPLGWAGTYLYTQDAGQTWTAMQSPAGTSVFDVTFPSENMGYMVGAEGAVLRYAGGNTVGVIEGPVHDGPTSVFLQNKPNPARDLTTFSFEVPNRGPVSLKVYDLQGREVATILNEELLPGAYTRDLEVGNMASGVYYYRLQMKNVVETRQMVVIK